MGIKIFEEQMGVILENTQREQEKAKEPNPKGIEMVKVMVSIITKYVKTEAEGNSSFAESLGYPWKSAERMLKYVWGKAKECATNMQGGMCACVPDDVVFDWINEYYALDDREEVEEELRKEAEAEAKRKAEEEADKLMQKEAEEKALKKLNKDEEWSTLSEEEQEKKLKAEADKIKSRLKAAAKRKAKKEKEEKEKEVKASESENNSPAADNVEPETVEPETVEPETKTIPESETLRFKEGQVYSISCMITGGIHRCTVSARTDTTVTFVQENSEADGIHKSESEYDIVPDGNGNESVVYQTYKGFKNVVYAKGNEEKIKQEEHEIVPSGKNGQFSLFDLLG